MINELYNLSSTLECKGISGMEWHREYKQLPKVTSKTPCIRIWIAKDGSICELESISSELAQSLRKYGNNQGTFPAFNIVPLYRITDDEQLSELNQLVKNNVLTDLNKIVAWCVNDNWKGSVVNKIDRSLHSISRSLLNIIGIKELPEYDLISELVHLTDYFSDEPDKSFRKALEKCIFEKLLKKEDISMMLSLLFHQGNPQKAPSDDIGVSLSVILDLYDWQKYGHPVASQYITEWINKMLLESRQSSPSTQSMEDESDAFGSYFVNPDEPMPSVRLNGFDVILRSMFNGQPCQHRYKKIDDASYPISNENRSRTKKSLEWIAKSDMEGITWQKVDKNEIVFAYPSRLPDVSSKLVSILGLKQADKSERTEDRFENISKEFIKAFKGIPTQQKPDFIQIFAIRKIGKGRSKVIFTRNCTSEALIHAAERWEEGCRNIPEIHLGKVSLPFPLQVAQIINNVWKQNGELAQGKTIVERMKYYQGIELLLDLMQESMICNYLNIVLTHSSGLINYIGNWEHGSFKSHVNTEDRKSAKLKQETALLLMVFGLFLYKHNDRKEKYMESMAYLVGQLLKISDELHTMYCKVMRNGEIPPQLAGSALFVSAGEMPSQAMTQLSLRMNPYITWAKQYRFKNFSKKYEESWRAGWYLSLYEDVANKLNTSMTGSIRFNDFDKAQLFIGYLASFPKREPSSAGNGDSKDDIGAEGNIADKVVNTVEDIESENNNIGGSNNE